MEREFVRSPEFGRSVKTQADGNPPKFLRWTVALFFLLTGGAKLIGLVAMQPTFEDFAYPHHLTLVVGVLEIAGAIGLLLPGLALWAALGLCGIMIGALFSHLAYASIYKMLRALVVLGLLACIAWSRRPALT